MEKNFEYRFDKSLGIVFKTYHGPISIEDITHSWKYAFENKLIPDSIKGFILDYRDANFNLKVGEHDEIAIFYKKHLNVFGNLKIAILTENPRDIVIPMLVENKDDGYQSKAFSTLQAATNWVLI